MTSQQFDDFRNDSSDDELDTCDFQQMYQYMSKFSEHQETYNIDEVKSMLKMTNKAGYSFLMWCAQYLDNRLVFLL